jgi:hypothetical protein
MQVASDIMVVHLGNRCHDPSDGSGGGDPRAAGADTAGAADGAAEASASGGRQGAECVPRSSEVRGRQGPWGKCERDGDASVACLSSVATVHCRDVCGGPMCIVLQGNDPLLAHHCQEHHGQFLFEAPRIKREDMVCIQLSPVGPQYYVAQLLACC